MVSTAAVYDGMLRLNFLLEACQPGTVPDAHLIAAVLDLVFYRLIKMYLVWSFKNSPIFSHDSHKHRLSLERPSYLNALTSSIDATAVSGRPGWN